jgi:hypothetical protein
MQERASLVLRYPIVSGSCILSQTDFCLTLKMTSVEKGGIRSCASRPAYSYSGEGNRARALAYSLGCLRAALCWSELCVVVRIVPAKSRGGHLTTREQISSLNSRNLLLCPVQVAAHFTSIADAFLESLASPGKTGLGLLLQIHELAVLGIQLSR